MGSNIGFLRQETNDCGRVVAQRHSQYGLRILSKHRSIDVLAGSGRNWEWKCGCDAHHDCGNRQGEEIPDTSFLGSPFGLQFRHGCRIGIRRMFGGSSLEFALVLWSRWVVQCLSIP